jgi:hypothetical protein
MSWQRFRLNNVLENEDEYRENEVREMMFDLWVQFNSESVEQ